MRAAMMFKAVRNKFHYKCYKYRYRRVCTKCNKCDAFISIAEYERHLKNVHNERERGICGWCRTLTIERENLDEHRLVCLKQRLDVDINAKNLTNNVNVVRVHENLGIASSISTSSFVVFLDQPDYFRVEFV